MIWLTWRQFRTQAVVDWPHSLAALLVVLAADPARADRRCATSTRRLPPAAGIPPDRPLLSGAAWRRCTARPAAHRRLLGRSRSSPASSRPARTGWSWTQSVTRQRWLAVKLGLAALATVAATGLLSLTVSWWAKPVDNAVAAGNGSESRCRASHRVIFGARGIVPMGYVAFALALGVALGLVLDAALPPSRSRSQPSSPFRSPCRSSSANTWRRRRRWSMPVTEETFRGLGINGNPVTAFRLEVDSDLPGDWVLSGRTLDSTGTPVEGLPSWFGACGPPPPGAPQQQQAPRGHDKCLNGLFAADYQQEISYQPASRFWALQWRERGCCSGLPSC